MRVLIPYQGEKSRPAQFIPSRVEGDAAPASYTEAGLWISQQLALDSVKYNEPLAIRLSGTLDLSVLEQSLRTLITRHEILRTSYTANNHELTRVISNKVPCDFSVVDLQSQSNSQEARYRLFDQLANEEIRKPFELSKLPLLRSHVFRIDAQTHILLLILHHIVTDGWSTGIIIKEICALYRAGTTGVPVKLPMLPIQYADYALWQHNRKKTHEAQLEFWRAQLTNLPTHLPLPADRPLPIVRSPHGTTVSRRSTGSLGAMIRQLSVESNTTEFVILQAAFKLLLHRYTGDADIAIGTPAANRVQPVLANVVGCFINILVLRSDLSGDLTFKQFVVQEKARCYAAYRHQETPFQTLVADIAPPRIPGITPLFKVLFTQRVVTRIDLSGTGISGERVQLHNGSAKYDISVEAVLMDDGKLNLWAEYSTDLFDAQTVTEWLKSYEALLHSLIKVPTQSIRSE